MLPACISSELGSTAVQFGEKTSPGLCVSYMPSFLDCRLHVDEAGTDTWCPVPPAVGLASHRETGGSSRYLSSSPRPKSKSNIEPDTRRDLRKAATRASPPGSAPSTDTLYCLQRSGLLRPPFRFKEYRPPPPLLWLLFLVKAPSSTAHRHQGAERLRPESHCAAIVDRSAARGAIKTPYSVLRIHTDNKSAPLTVP